MGMTGPAGGTGGRRGRGTRRAPMSEINVTPLVDVMLVLLIIFMITAPLLASAVPIDLPESRAKPVETEEQEPVQLSIGADDTIYIGDQAVAEADLPARLEVIAREDRGKERPRPAKAESRSARPHRATPARGSGARSGRSCIGCKMPAPARPRSVTGCAPSSRRNWAWMPSRKTPSLGSVTRTATSWSRF